MGEINRIADALGKKLFDWTISNGLTRYRAGLDGRTEGRKDTVALSPRGEIIIDERGQTSLPGVFAAGDATTVPFKQIVIAMGAGSTAALSAFDHLIRSPAPVEAAGTAQMAEEAEPAVA